MSRPLREYGASVVSMSGAAEFAGSPRAATAAHISITGAAWCNYGMLHSNYGMFHSNYIMFYSNYGMLPREPTPPTPP